MRILNIGSLNYDYVYQMDHIMLPKETQTAKTMQLFTGGKGLNQSIALAKAGATVYHGGMIGEDGERLREVCQSQGVNGTFIQKIPGSSGHTIIQVDKDAENCILLYPGANRCLTKAYVDEVLSNFEKGDILLLQNEVNELPYLINQGYEIGMTVALNPSPFDHYIMECDLEKVGIFVMNEIEGEQLTKESAQHPERILAYMEKNYPNSKVVLTLGKEGAIYMDGGTLYRQAIYPVKAVDTTAAGDTFTGYFLAGLAEGLDIPSILRNCAMASAIAVTKPGAVASIPSKEEVLKALQTVCL